MVADLESVQTAPVKPRRLPFIIAALQLMLLLSAIDQTIVSTAMPKIVTALGGFDRYAWAITSYLLTSTISIPIIGRISDIFGRKRLLLAGVILFVLSSLLCGVSGLIEGSAAFIDPMTQFIIGRTFQGVGGGLVVGLSFTVIADLFSPAERGKYQGHFAAIFAIASVLGPTLGGLVADNGSWRWLFYVNLPIGLLSMALFAAFYPDDERRSQARLDLPGIVSFAVAMTAYLLGMSAAASCGWFSPPCLCAALVAGIASFWFIQAERSTDDPFVPLAFFKNNIVTISCLSVFATGIGLFGSTLMVPLVLQGVFGMGVSKSGTLMSPLIIIVALTSIAGGAWLSRTKRYKKLVITSLFLMTAGTYLFAFVLPTMKITALFTAMAVVGSGLGLLLPVYTVVIQNAVAQQNVGAVTGFSQFFRSVGGTTGVTALGSLLQALYRTGLIKSLPAASPAALAILFNPLEPAKLKANLLANQIDSATAEHFCQAVQSTLIGTIKEISLIYAVILTAVLILNLYLEEKPLRETTPESGQ